MQRKLHALGNERNEHQHKNAGGKVARHIRIGPQGATSAVIDNQNASQQPVARDVRHQQNFARACDCFRILVPESHQAEGAESDHFPAEIENEEVRAVDQPDEPADENQHGAEEAGRGLVVRHVADGVQQNESTNTRTHEREQNTQCVHVQNQRKRRIPLEHCEIDGLPGCGPNS